MSKGFFFLNNILCDSVVYFSDIFLLRFPLFLDKLENAYRCGTEILWAMTTMSDDQIIMRFAV